MSRVQPARSVAAQVLAAVRTSDAYANLLLPTRIREAGLTGSDAGFATELVYGTLRWQGYYDRVIELAAKRSAAKIDAPVLDVLRMAAHQLLTLETARHAVLNESVELVRIARKASASGFVNGVLRQIARSTPDEWRARALEGLSGTRRLAVEFSHPHWIVLALRAALDDEAAAQELTQLLASDNTPPRVAFAAMPGLADASELAHSGDYAPGRISPIALESTGGDPSAHPEVTAGAVRVQDEGSQLAALALTRARAVRAGERWLDMCAGPGGKAAVLAAEAALGGAQLTANEMISARAGLVRQALTPFADLDDAPVVLEGDARRFAQAGDRFDRILLDAPCSGLGALRRRPEARWRKRPDDLAGLLALQEQLLDAAVAALAPGGLLAYVTCSPHVPETVHQVAAVLERHPQLHALDTPEFMTDLVHDAAVLGTRRSVQLWPHRHGTDAMFVQLFTTLDA